MSNDVEDRELIEQALGGDQASFECLVKKYKNMVFNICVKMLSDNEEALDVAQDIFIKLYDSLKHFRAQAKFSTYLYRICINFCNNRLKALSRRRKKEAYSLDCSLQTNEGTMSREVASNDLNPRDILEAKKKNEIIMKALDELSPEHREIIILKEIEGLSYEEIADVLQIDMGTVKSRLNRARFAMKEKLEGIL